MGVLGNVTRSASVTAKTPLTVLVLTASACRRLSREQPEVAKRLRKAIEERRHHLEPMT
jgi:CRP-like cAMP-binding protein